MRFAALLALAGLCVSVPFAYFHYESRPGRVDASGIVVPDARERARIGAENGWSGVELDAWSTLAAASPDNTEALRERIRVGIHQGAVDFERADLVSLVAEQTDAYLARPSVIDPDGSLLQEILDDWIESRLALDPTTHFLHKTVVGIFLAGRGDPRGQAWLAHLAGAKEGEYHEIFPYEFMAYGRRMHPHWRAVGPVAARFLEAEEHSIRAEATYNLLHYNLLWGAGQDLLDRHLASIRTDLRDYIAFLATGERTEMSGRVAILALAMLAARGDAEERALLQGMQRMRFPAYLIALDLARVEAGLDGLDTIAPGRPKFAEWQSDDWLLYLHVCAHHVARIDALPGAEREARAAERALAMSHLENAFEGPDPTLRYVALSLLRAVDGERAARAIQQALNERGAHSVFAALLSDEKNLVPHLLPALRSREIDIPALAAVGLLDLPGGSPLQK